MLSAQEIREHLIDQLNSVMKRPSMYGGWVAADVTAMHLAFIDGYDEPQIRIIDYTARSGSMRFVDERVPDPDQNLYFALHLPEFHRRGWFRPTAVLTPEAHADLLTTFEPWLADRRRQCDVVEAFGPPSWRHGNALAYATADPADPMVVFVAHDDAITAAWTSEELFPEGLRLTTAGKELLAERPTS